MIHLVYTMRLTRKARHDVAAFWRWVHDRETWFYEGLDMVRQTRTVQCLIGHDVYSIEHWVSFDDEAAWGRYRQAVRDQCADPEWERRRVEQDDWWHIVQARIMTDPPRPRVSE